VFACVSERYVCMCARMCVCVCVHGVCVTLHLFNIWNMLNCLWYIFAFDAFKVVLKIELTEILFTLIYEKLTTT